MSNYFTLLQRGLLYEDTEGWQRLANPLSFWLRNGAIVVTVVLLWWRMWLGWWTVAGLLMVALFALLAVRMPGARSAPGWHHDAIMGERCLILIGVQELPPKRKIQLLLLKLCDTVATFGLLAGLLTMHGVLVVSGSVVFFAIRLALLEYTRLLYLSSLCSGRVS